MTGSSWPVSEDPVKQLIDRANVLLGDGSPDPVRVGEFVAGRSPRELTTIADKRRWIEFVLRTSR